MTERQKVEVRLSEVKKGLNELGSKTELSDEDRAQFDKLKTEYGDLEVRYQALTISEEGDKGSQEVTETPEAKERKELEARCSIGEIFASVMEHRTSEGAEAELQKELGLADNQVPLCLLEKRAVTPAPTDTGAVQSEIVMPVFADGVAAFLGVDMPTVPVGDSVYPVLTNRPTVGGPHKDSTAVSETTGSFSAEVLSPARLQASFFYRRTDAARFRGMGEALRQALEMALSEEVDAEIVNGDEGLLHGTNLANHNVNSETDFGDYIKDFAYGRVDGRFALSASDIRVVMGSGGYAHAGETYRNNSVDRTALDRLMEITGGIRVSAHVPNVSSNKQNQIIRRGMRRDMVAPMWEGVTLIPDEVTKAATGEIVITAVLLHAVKILRTDGFYKQQLQVN